MASITLSRDFILKAMQSAGVRGEVQKKARSVASRVNALGSSEGVDMDAKVVSGTRPKGRPYSNVVSYQVDQEWGNRRSKRRRIMGRVGESS